RHDRGRDHAGLDAAPAGPAPARLHRRLPGCVPTAVRDRVLPRRRGGVGPLIMRLWLVRHARPLVPAGLCYGSLEVAADDDETRVAAQRLAQVLPPSVSVLVSPRQRCAQLAQALAA